MRRGGSRDPVRQAGLPDSLSRLRIWRLFRVRAVLCLCSPLRGHRTGWAGLADERSAHEPRSHSYRIGLGSSYATGASFVVDGGLTLMAA